MELLRAKDGVNTHSRDINGRTPLSWVAMHGHKLIVRQLLLEDSKEIEYGWTPLLRAAEKGHGEVMKLVAADRACLEFTESSDWTPLWLALMYGHEEVVKLLLAKDGVSLNPKNNNYWTALWLAVEYVWARGGSEATSSI